MTGTLNQFTADQIAWIEALESGRFEKTTGRLSRDTKRHCCLGVACRVLLGKPGRGKGWRAIAGNLPGDLADRLRLHSDGGMFIGLEEFRGQLCLVNVNDETPTTFPEIAAEMRARPWLFFTNFDAPEGQP